MVNLLSTILAIVLSMTVLAFQGSNITGAGQLANTSGEIAQLTSLGGQIDSMCAQTNFTCSLTDDVNAPFQPLGTEALKAITGYIPAVPVPALGGTYQVTIAHSAQSPLSENTAVLYSSAQILGSVIIGKVKVYAAGVFSTPVAGTSYTLVHDRCLGGVYATTSTTPLTTCP